jgi:small subunit ribosomal protein SAe
LRYLCTAVFTTCDGRFTPGSFTNYINRSFNEPRLIVVIDPRVDHQAIREAPTSTSPSSYSRTRTRLKYVDVAIPTNKKSRHAIGLVWWILAREMLRFRGTIPRTPDGWYVTVDMFFYRDPEEVERQQQERRKLRPLLARAKLRLQCHRVGRSLGICRRRYQPCACYRW